MDSEFIKEGNRILKEEKVYDKLRICDVNDIEETIKELMPRVRLTDAL